MFLRSAAVQQIGLLNESFFMYGEDAEYCWRLQEAGWQVRLPADVTVAHRGRTSAERTWGPTQSAARIREGWYKACAVTRGARYARCLMALDGLALRVEAALPWHSRERRGCARAQALEISSLLREL
jgi:GT2 family glycosyltransferase